MKQMLSRLFGLGVRLRNRAYDREWMTVTRISVPVISVGNISVGGTGKTPVVEFLARHFLDMKKKTAVVTRGYKRETKGQLVISDGAGNVVSVRDGGDEPVQMALKFPSLIVVADTRRVEGCNAAVERLGAEIILLDDGFQHRACARDLDIVLLDAQVGLQGQELLPAGRLREPPEHLARADLILLTRCEDTGRAKNLATLVSRHSDAPVILTRFRPVLVRDARTGEDVPSVALTGRPVVAFCGIGNPASFRTTLESLAVETELLVEFADHHPYTTSDIDRLLQRLEKAESATLITTEKDITRLRPMLEHFGVVPLLYPLMDIDYPDGEQLFLRLVDEFVGC